MQLASSTISPYALPGIKAKNKVKNQVTTIEYMAGICCQFFKTTLDSLNVKSRERHLVLQRQFIMYYLYKSGYTCKATGELFNRDHTTVLHAITAIDNQRQTDENIDQQYKNFKNYILNNS